MRAALRTHVMTARDLVALVKPNIMVMSLLTAAGAASLAPGHVATATMFWLLAGTAFIVGAANALNMYLERDIDCMMARTKQRPLPQGRLAPSTALGFGTLLGMLAIPSLGQVNLVTAALGLLALILYVGVYTPMKQRSHWAVWVGGVPGAMPALMGWTAAMGRVDLAGLAVFGVLFFWQVPHFHAIAMYRQKDYDAAGLKTLPGQHGWVRARYEIAIFLVAQVAVSFAVVGLGVAGTLYAVVAGLLGATVIVQGFAGLTRGDAKWARHVFLASIVYMPVLFAVMVFDGRA